MAFHYEGITINKTLIVLVHYGEKKFEGYKKCHIKPITN